MASTRKPTRNQDRICFVCKRSILLFKYTNLTTIRQGSNSQKKDIIRQLETVLDCDDNDSREWKYICEPCLNTSCEISQHLEKSTVLSDEITTTKDLFLAKYKAPGVLKIQSSKKFGSSRSLSSASSSKTSQSPSSPLGQTGKRESQHHKRVSCVILSATIRNLWRA